MTSTLVTLVYRGEPGLIRHDDKPLKPGDVVITNDPVLIQDLEGRNCFERLKTAVDAEAPSPRSRKRKEA